MTEMSKTCPTCGPAHRLALRTNSYTNEKFLGCPKYPECTYTEALPLDLEMRLAGVATLPGFGD